MMCYNNIAQKLVELEFWFLASKSGFPQGLENLEK